jgi:hypothetical protein
VGDPVKKTGVHGTCPLAYLKDFDIILDMMPDMMHIEKGDCEFCVCMCSFIYLVVLIYLKVCAPLILYMCSFNCVYVLIFCVYVHTGVMSGHLMPLLKGLRNLVDPEPPKKPGGTFDNTPEGATRQTEITECYNAAMARFRSVTMKHHSKVVAELKEWQLWPKQLKQVDLRVSGLRGPKCPPEWISSSWQPIQRMGMHMGTF